MKPSLKAPPGTTDTHMHIYNRRYATAPTATFTPPDSFVEDYLAMCKEIGIERTVVVQPSTYGTNNECTLEAMKAIGSGARGIAVVDTSVSEAELERLTGLGIRGIRFHMLPGGALPWELMEEMAARVLKHGWHVQCQLDGRTLPDRIAMLRRLPGTLVIDHVGKFLEPVPADHPAFKLLLGLVENGKTYIKLSAPYEVSKVGPPNYDDVGALAKALVKAAPDRMLWASNWPHPTPNGPRPSDAGVLDYLLDWVPDEAVRKAVLVNNPARVYGY